MSRIRSICTPLAVAATVAVLAAGCGSGNASVVRPPSGTPSTESPSPTAPMTSSSATVPHPRTTVRPATGLHAGQTVTVTAAGFSPGLSLIVVECADKGKQTGAGDCNLAASATVQTDSAGRTSTPLTVTPGPFGANNIICSAKVHCLISVTQASLSPTQEADAPITFR